VSTIKNLKPISQAKDPDLRGAVAAMQRAAQSARLIAKQTNTYLVVEQNGQLVKLTVN
jgi:hypothetical protein